MAASYDLNIVKGSQTTIRLTVKNDSGGFLNISGYGLRGNVKHRYSDTGILLDLKPSGVAGFLDKGLIQIDFSAAETKNLPVVQAVYDLEIFSGDYVEKIIGGFINIFPEVTTNSL